MITSNFTMSFSRHLSLISPLRGKLSNQKDRRIVSIKKFIPFIVRVEVNRQKKRKQEKKKNGSNLFVKSSGNCLKLVVLTEVPNDTQEVTSRFLVSSHKTHIMFVELTNYFFTAFHFIWMY